MKKAINIVFNTCYDNQSVSFYQKVLAVSLIVVFVIIPLVIIIVKS